MALSHPKVGCSQWDFDPRLHSLLVGMFAEGGALEHPLQKGNVAMGGFVADLIVALSLLACALMVATA